MCLPLGAAKVCATKQSISLPYCVSLLSVALCTPTEQAIVHGHGLGRLADIVVQTHAADRRKITPWPYRNRALAATTTS